MLACVGIMTLVAVGALAVCAVWTIRVRREAWREQGEKRLREIAACIESAVSRAATDKDGITELRELVLDTGRSANLTTCRVRLPSGGIVADLEPARHEVDQLPEKWGGSAATARAIVNGPVCTIIAPVKIRGRGEAEVEVTGEIGFVGWRDLLGEYLMVAGAAGAVVVVGWRVLRGRLLALGAIHRALGAASAGEVDAGALRVAERFGAEAKAWNALVAERESLRRSQALRAADDAAAGLGGVREADLATACDAMWMGLLIVDRSLGVKYCNGAAATFLRVRRDDLIGSDLRKHVKDAGIVEAVEGVAGGRVKHRTSVETTRAGEGAAESPSPAGRGASVLRFSVKPARHDDATATMVIIEDVTQQRVADESRNAFVAQATHELRTPLTNIRLYVDSLVEAGEEDAATRTKCVNVISQEARRLERIVGDLLSISEIEAGSLKLRKGDVRLEELLKELYEDYRAQAEDKEMQFEVLIPPKLTMLSADRDKVALALHNLIGNAIKYTPAGGRVSVRTEESEGRVRVRVTDNGIGIRPEEQELIFEKFYRAKDKRVASIVGSGLGLALVRDIARMHGGEVAVQSELDRGSTFTLELPIESPGAVSQAA